MSFTKDYAPLGASPITWIGIREVALLLLGKVMRSLWTSDTLVVRSFMWKWPASRRKISCSFVYSTSNKKGREDLFNQLEGFKPHIVGLWLIMGAFNCIANINERIGLRPRNHEMEPLRRCMEVCEVHDLKSAGRFFTCNNKQEGTARVLSKIDHVLGNQSYRKGILIILQC